MLFQLKYFLWSKGLDGIAYVLSKLPVSFISLGVRLMARVWFDVIPIRVNLIVSNLKHAFGSDLSQAEIEKIAVKNLEHYLYFFLEFILFRALSTQEFQGRFEIEGLTHVQTHFKKDEKIFVLTAHLGNFEWLASWVPLAGIPLGIVVRTLKNKVFNAIVSEQRQRTGVHLIFAENSKWKIMKLLSEKNVIGFMLDQRKSPPGGIFVHFFGRPAATTQGLAYLVERSAAVVVPAFIERKTFGYFKIHIQPALSYKKVGNRRQTIYDLTQLYTRTIENQIRKYPEQWFWIHRRWRE